MKLNLIYYKNILDVIVSRFINDYNDSFTKINDYYVMSASIDKTSLKRYMSLAVKNFINELYELVHAQHGKLIIIGACYPSENILLSLNTSKFPSKLQLALDSRSHIKYVLKEHDILIDIDMFNAVSIELFNEWFSNDAIHNKTFKGKSNDIVFVSHKNLDCYMVFKAIKWIYGQSNCVNIWKNKLNMPCEHITAINDLVSRYSNNKRLLNSNKQFKLYANELKDYLNGKLGI